MIGPTPAFYNPEDTSLQQGLDHGQYQQWIEGYGPQQQQNQQTQHHYPQQMVYDTSYHGSLDVPIPLSYQFTQPQYQSSSSLSQYDGSTTGTVTQSNVVQSCDNSYQGQSNVYPQVYPEFTAMRHSAASTPERIPEAVNHPHSRQGPQQNPSQQSRQFRQKPSRAQHRPHTFLAHPSSSEFTSSNPSPSHSSSLTPPSIVWSTEPGYSNPKPIENAFHGGQSSFRVPSSDSGSSRPPTSQNTPAASNSPNPYPTSSGVLGSSPRTSPPRSNDSTFVSEKTGNKRKKLSGHGKGSDSDIVEDEGMAGGISVGMGGLGVVGKGTGTKGSRLWVIIFLFTFVWLNDASSSFIVHTWVAEWMINYNHFLTLMLMLIYWRLFYFIYLHRYPLRHRFRNPVFSWHLWIIILSMALILFGGLFRRSNFNSVHCHRHISRRCPLCDPLSMVPFRLEDPEPARTARSSRCAEILFNLTSLFKKTLADCSWLTWILWSFSLLRDYFVPFFTYSGFLCQLRFPNNDPIWTPLLRIPNTSSGPGVNRWNVIFRKTKIHANGAKMVDMFA